MDKRRKQQLVVVGLIIATAVLGVLALVIANKLSEQQAPEDTSAATSDTDDVGNPVLCTQGTTWSGSCGMDLFDCSSTQRGKGKCDINCSQSPLGATGGESTYCSWRYYCEEDASCVTTNYACKSPNGQNGDCNGCNRCTAGEWTFLIAQAHKEEKENVTSIVLKVL